MNPLVVILVTAVAFATIIGVNVFIIVHYINKAVDKLGQNEPQHDLITDEARFIKIDGEIAAIISRVVETETTVQKWFRKINARMDREGDHYDDEELVTAFQQNSVAGNPPIPAKEQIEPPANVPFVPGSRLKRG